MSVYTQDPSYTIDYGKSQPIVDPVNLYYYSLEELIAYFEKKNK